MKTRNDHYSSNPRPISPPITNLTSNFTSDRELMKKLVDDKITLHNTLFSKFIGTPTCITYISQIISGNADNMRSSNGINTLTTELKSYKMIKNLEVRIEDSIGINQEGDDIAKSYVRTGQMKILPETIVPYIGDFFILEYMNNQWLFNVTSVNKEAIEMNSGFIVEFEVANEGERFNFDTWGLKDRIVEELYFQAAHIGTSFKTILSKDEITDLEEYKEFYNFLGRIYISYFYDKNMNVFLLKNVMVRDPLKIQDIKNTQINNKIYGGKTVYYDNFLNYFIRNNNIFNNIDNKIVTPSTLAGIDDLEYLNTIYSAITNRDVDLLKYYFTCSEKVNQCSIYLPAILFGLDYVKYTNNIENVNNAVELFPKDFFSTIFDFNLDSLEKFENREYNSYITIIMEIIALYLNKIRKSQKYEVMEEIRKRINFLIKNRNKLMIDNLFPQHIFYLYPLLAYIIIDFLENKFNKNI